VLCLTGVNGVQILWYIIISLFKLHTCWAYKLTARDVIQI
jgi:hypothetical protein